MIPDGPNWPAVLDALDREAAADCEPVELPAPPFQSGQRVYIAGHPGTGSVEIVGYAPHPGGGWRVEARDGNYRVVMPEDNFRLCPPGWTEPPQPPSAAEMYDYGPAGWSSGWAAEQAWQDPEYVARYEAWVEESKRWRAWLDGAAP